jgi:hypothetical protein
MVRFPIGPVMVRLLKDPVMVRLLIGPVRVRLIIGPVRVRLFNPLRRTKKKALKRLKERAHRLRRLQ